MKILLYTLVLGAMLVTLPGVISGQVRVRRREPISQNVQIDHKQQHVVEKRGVDLQSLQDQINQLMQESLHNPDANVDEQIWALQAQIIANTDWAAWQADQDEFWNNHNGNNNGEDTDDDGTDTGLPTDIIIVISVIIPIVGFCICIALVCIIVNCSSPRRKARTIGTSQYPTTAQHTDTAYPPNAAQHINTTYTPNEYMNGPTNYNTSYEPHNYNRSTEPPAEASANQDYHPRPSAPIDTGAEWEVPKPYGQPSMQPNDPPPYESLFSEKSKM